MKVAFVFAGQGAQTPGMGRELYEVSQGARTVLDTMEALCPGLLDMAFRGSREDLNRTENTQPCLFAVSLAAAAALTDLGVSAQGTAGFSLGEVTAAAYSGLLLPETAFAYCLRRAAAMGDCAAAVPGAMAAVMKLPRNAVEALCELAGEVWPANYNAPGQIVVSGRAEAVARLCTLAAEHKGRAVPLAVGGGFHSPLMRPASDALRPVLDGLDFQPPAIPQYANTTAALFTAEAAPKLMADAVSRPVYWEDTVRRMVSDGFDVFVELGPGQVLSGLIKKTVPEVPRLHVEDAESLRTAAQALTDYKKEAGR